MDLKLKMGGLLAILGVYYFFSMWPFLVMCGTMGYLFHVWGGVCVELFSFFLFL